MQAQVYGLRRIDPTEMCLLNGTGQSAGATKHHGMRVSNQTIRLPCVDHMFYLTVHGFVLALDLNLDRLSLQSCLITNDVLTRRLVRALRRCRCIHMAVVHAVVCMPTCLTVSPSLS
jgi:hypothetical protein